MSNQIRIKVYHLDQIRRFTITSTTDLKTFKSVIEEFYPKISSSAVFKYEDEEGELITFSTELEWADALKQNLDVLRIYADEKKCEKKCEKHKCTRSKDIKVKPGDIVYELSEKEVVDYLKTGEINITLPSGHQNIICDGCNKSGFSGTRFHCLGCKDFDFCDKCHTTYGEKHFGGSHKFEKIPDLKDSHFGDVVAHFVNEKDQEKMDRKLAKKIHREERAEAKELKREEKALKKEEKKLAKKVEKVEKIEKKEVAKESKKPELVQLVKEEVKIAPLYPKVEEKFVPKPVLEIVVPTAPKEDIKPPSPIVKPVSPIKEVRDEKYSIHYKILENMGFDNIQLSTVLLNKDRKSVV